MNKAVVELSDVGVVQGSKTILEGINLKIQHGELVYLIGKTGTGKTSLLRSLYADLPLAKGQALVAGFKIQGISRKRIPYLRRKIGIVFQDFQLLTDRNVKENLLFIMKATGWKKRRLINQRLKEVLELVGLSAHSDKYPHELSGGEQQRVVIARALINEPFVLLADEPTGNLDPQTSKDILDLLAKISESGTAIFMATHNYNLIHYHPSRVLKIENQHLVETSPDSISF